MNENQKVAEFMTDRPRTISSDLTLAEANRKMHELNVRHLPVLNGGKLLGLISERDLQSFESLKDVDSKELTVGDAITEEILKVEAETSLKEVCKKMVDRKFGSALVMDNGKLVGIFTWIDALKALGNIN